MSRSLAPATVLDALSLRHRSRLVIQRELDAEGVSRFASGRLVASGAAVRYAPSVLGPASRPLARNGSLWVAARYHEQLGHCSPPPLLTGAAPLALQRVEGFDVPSRPQVRWSLAPRLLDPPWESLGVRPIPENPLVIEGLCCAGPGLALADHALDPSVTDRALRVAVDAVRWRDRATLEDLRARWEELGRHPGARRLLALYFSGVLDQESDGERDAWKDVFLPSGPLPDCQVWLSATRRVDFVFLGAALIIEYLGVVHEGLLEQDAQRTFELSSLGYELLPLTKGVLHRDAGGFARHVHARRRDREELARRGLLRVAPVPLQPPRRVPLRTLVPLG